MRRQIILTKDGSHTLSVPEMNVTYHSIHGAIQESLHVFIKEGLLYQVNKLTDKRITLFEAGLGTGLNALLTLTESEKTKTEFCYEAVELFPLSNQEVKELNYCRQLNRADLQPLFEKIHSCEWEKEIAITDKFILRKVNASLINYLTNKHFNLIYFDAFAPNAQPELWSREVFDKMYSFLVRGGVLVTYCSKGDVRRAMIAAGFSVEKIPGPPGKREMLRAARPY